MPPGKAILDSQYHLGSLLLTTSTDLVRVFGNDLSSYGHVPIDVHFFTLREGLGTVGSPLGGPDPDDTVHRFMGAIGSNVFIGGHNGVWIYDTVRGGLHPWDSNTGSGTGAFANVFSTEVSGTEVLLYNKYGYQGNLYNETAFTANSSQDSTLESNYFDFNIPAERKEITHVTVRTDDTLSANETWTVAVSTDDAAFVDVATVTSADAGTVKKRLSATQYGYRFRYRVTWSSSGTETPPSRLKGIFFHALEGELVPTWNLVMDGKEFRNVEGGVMRPEAARAWLLTLMDTEQVVTFVDGFSNAAASPSYNVKVEACRIEGDTPNEFKATVVLVEDI